MTNQIITRCGALVLIVHDFADAFLEAAKLFHYAKYDTVCDIIFGIFATR
jgi:ceramide synthetase